MSSCLVVGGNGFIGSHVVDELVARGHVVTAFDRFSSETESYTSTGVRAVVGDFANPRDVATALEGQEQVFLFVGSSSPAVSDAVPSLELRADLPRTIEFLEAASAAGVQRLFFASTGGAIYGDQGRAAYDETAPTLPVSPYGITKLTVEHFLRYFRLKHGLDGVSLRLANPYGPRQHPHRRQGLIPIALRAIARNEKVVRVGSGAMVRDFIYVTDLARRIARLAGGATRHEVYNIGSGRGASVAEVLDLVRKVVGRDFEIDEVAIPSSYVERVVLDTSRYEDEFGPDELIGLEEGIAATWDWELRST